MVCGSSARPAISQSARNSRAPRRTKWKSGSRVQLGHATRRSEDLERSRKDVGSTVDIVSASKVIRKRRAQCQLARGALVLLLRSCCVFLLDSGYFRRALDLDEDRVAVEPQVRPRCDIERHHLLTVDQRHVGGAAVEQI